jgi:hypothetical protein
MTNARKMFLRVQALPMERWASAIELLNYLSLSGVNVMVPIFANFWQKISVSLKNQC